MAEITIGIGVRLFLRDHGPPKRIGQDGYHLIGWYDVPGQVAIEGLTPVLFERVSNITQE